MDQGSVSSPAPPSVANAEDVLDAAVLDTLITEYPALFSHDEIVRHFSRSDGLDGDLHITDALTRLVADGLIHRNCDFYFATRAAVGARRLSL